MAAGDLTHRRSSTGSPLALQVLLAILLAQPLLGMLTKMTLNRGFLYLAMLLPPLGLAFVAFQRERFPVSRNILYVATASYIAALLVASAIGVAPKEAASIMATKYSAAAAFILAWIGVGGIRDVRSLLRAIFLVGCLSTVYSIWQQVIGFPNFETDWAWSLGNVHGVDIFMDEARRSTGIAIYSATNGLLLTQCLMLLVALPVGSSKARLQRWLWVITFGLALLFSQTRGIWLGAFAGILVILMFKRILAGRSLAGLVPAILLQALLVLIAYFANPIVHARINSFKGMFTDPTHPFLFRILSTWIPTLRSHPPNLLGYGPGAVKITDNMFLQTLTSAGMVGIAIFLGLHAALLHVCWRRARSFAKGEPWLAAVFVGIAGIVIAELVSYITGDYMLAAPANIIFWALAGAAMALPLAHRSTVSG